MRISFSTFIIALSLFTLLISCKRNDGLGADIIGTDPQSANTIDTFKVLSYSTQITQEERDSLNFIGFNKASIGYYNDPIFGNVKSSYVAQLKLPNSNFDLTVEPLNVLKSMTFNLEIDSFYGAAIDSQTFHLYRFLDPNEAFSTETSYFGNNPILAENLASDVIIEKLSSITISPQEIYSSSLIRFPIDTAFANSFYNVMTGINFIEDQDALNNLILGSIVIVPDTQNVGDGLYIVDLNSASTGLKIDYQEMDSFQTVFFTDTIRTIDSIFDTSSVVSPDTVIIIDTMINADTTYQSDTSISMDTIWTYDTSVIRDSNIVDTFRIDTTFLTNDGSQTLNPSPTSVISYSVYEIEASDFVNDYYANLDTLVGSDTILVQGHQSHNFTVKFPTIDQLEGKAVLLADLIIPIINTGDQENYDVPSLIFANNLEYAGLMTSNFSESSVIEKAIEINGEVFNRYYKINVTEYISLYIEDRLNHNKGVRFILDPMYPNRGILAGNEFMKLNLTLTDIN